MATQDERITKLEVTQNFHTQRISFLENQGAKFAKALDSIQDNLNQIKWIAIGLGLGWIAKDVGLTELVKGLL